MTKTDAMHYDAQCLTTRLCFSSIKIRICVVYNWENIFPLNSIAKEFNIVITQLLNYIIKMFHKDCHPEESDVILNSNFVRNKKVKWELHYDEIEGR